MMTNVGLFRRCLASSSLSQVSRSYATATAAKVQAPLQLHGLDGRYATALFTAAAKKNKLDAVFSEFQSVKNQMDIDPALRFFFENPSLNRQIKTSGVQEILKRGKFSDVTTNFFKLLAENGRLAETSKIMDAFTELMRAHKGELLVTITSAKPLENKILSRVKDVLSKSSLVSSKQTLTVTNKVNPAIMGGMIVEVGDKIMDLSVSSKVAKLQKLLTDAV